MSRHPILIALVLALAAALSLAHPTAAAADERCYGDWSDAAPIVAREHLRSARDVHDMARHEFSSDIVRIVLCEAGGGFVYHLVLRRLDGRIATLTVSAVGEGAR
jgi:hypothetical protein